MKRYEILTCFLTKRKVNSQLTFKSDLDKLICNNY